MGGYSQAIFDTDPTYPQSAGKLKDLWDAVRQTAVDPATGMIPDAANPMSTGQSVTPDQPTLTSQVAGNGDRPVTDVPGLQRRAALAPTTAPPADPQAMAAQVAQINPNLPPSVTGAPPPPQPALPVGGVPSATQGIPMVATPNIADMPSAGRVGALTKQVNAAYAPPTLMQRLQRLAPVALGAIAGAVSHGHNPGFDVGTGEFEQGQVAQRQAARQGLTQQLEDAEKNQTQEFGTAQRTQEQANAALIAARERAEYAQIVAGGRQSVAGIQNTGKEAVANTNVAGRQAVATTQGQTARDVAQTRGGFQLDAATIAAQARVQAGKYAADAAANRQTRSIDAAAGRQQAGFGHTDTKPTADEDRRADLSTAFKGYSAELQDIATRRPDLFGPAAGRITSLRDAIGTGDLDIANLYRVKEALGTVALGAHSLRNATHIETAANKAANTNDTADAYLKTLQNANKDIDTFQQIDRPTLRSQTSAPAAAATKKLAPKVAPSSNDPLGIR